MVLGVNRIYEIVKSMQVFSCLNESERKAVDIYEGIVSTLIILHHCLKKDQNILRRDYSNI